MIGEWSYQWFGPIMLLSAATGFAAVAAYDRKLIAARLLTISYALGALAFAMIAGGAELSYVPRQLAIHLVAVVSQLMFLSGLSVLYGQTRRLAYCITTVLVLGIGANYLVTDPNRMLVQLAAGGVFFAGVAAYGFLTVYRNRRSPVDTMIAAILAIQYVQVVLRTTVGLALEADTLTPANFLDSTYAILMQMTQVTFATVVATALLIKMCTEIFQRLNELSETDPMTGLLNRRGFDAQAEKLMRQDGNLPTGLIACDIDHFKSINDRYGHSHGDAVIVAVAAVLRQHLPAGGVAARLGGEEFCLVVPRMTEETLRLLGEKLRLAVLSVRVADEDAAVTASFGCSLLTVSCNLRNALLQADIALYEAKRSGRDRVCFGDRTRIHEQPVSPVQMRLASA